MTLDEATTTQLMRELSSRVPAIIICLVVPDEKGETTTRSFRSGHRATCLGLAHVAVSRCEADLGMREIDDEDFDDEDPEEPS